MDDPIERMRQRVPGKTRFFSERFGGRPYDNCMIDSWMGPGAWVGYNLQDGDDDVIRAATGVADPDGMSFASLRKGVSLVFPDNLVTIGVADWDFILANIKRYGYRGNHKAQFGIALNMGKMPREYRRWAGYTYTKGHAVRLISRNAMGDQFYYYDVMQPITPPVGAGEGWYPGGWIPRTVLDAAVYRNPDGLIRVMYGYRNGYDGPRYERPTEETPA